MNLQAEDLQNVRCKIRQKSSKYGFYDTVGHKNNATSFMKSYIPDKEYTVPSICQGSPILKKTLHQSSETSMMNNTVLKKFQKGLLSRQQQGTPARYQATNLMPTLEKELRSYSQRSHLQNASSQKHNIKKNMFAHKDLSSIQPSPFILSGTKYRMKKDKHRKQGFVENHRTKSCTRYLSFSVGICLCPVLLALLCSVLFDLNAEEIPTDYQKISTELQSRLEDQVIGQHLVTNAANTSFKSALVDKNVKVTTLLLVGPSGSGKSFTRQILEDTFQEYGFNIIRKFRIGSPLENQLCEASPLLEENRNILLVYEDANHEFFKVMDTADKVATSNWSTRCHKVVIIIVSSKFGDLAKEFMFKNCLLGEQRMKINSSDLERFFGKVVNWLELFGKTDKKYRVIPFIYLPLGKEHLRICIRRHLSKRKIERHKWEHLEKKVLALMDFYPDCEMWFSESGCKLVSSRVDFVMDSKH